ncbi:MAG: chromate transporter [Treponema sp.]|nr:chromate transporter [Treponema sp.]
MLKSLLELYIVFFKIGAVTFGGGYAMLPILERELVTKRGWTTNEDLLDYYAISQVTPGVIAVNVSTFVGYKHKKVPGAIFSTAGVVTPSIIIISLIAMFISNFEDIVWVQKALAGINVGVSALLTYSVLSFAKKTIKKWWNIIFYAGAFIAVFFFKVPSFLVVITAILGGLLIGFFSGNLKKAAEAPAGEAPSVTARSSQEAPAPTARSSQEASASQATSVEEPPASPEPPRADKAKEDK